ncbi:hypothetical protein ZOD2009_01340 [Haladaptatus paucihalophilus DX253]|uniref:Uncharacterized protein n=1 Tax=Haladaptatus paucihalophilus DX253 TaxID=797209 RepID=E7QMV0_HALPU|nr:hypothetical protein ZOD2009_01340 [Haladaptatus paucihalophilus DX253]
MTENEPEPDEVLDECNQCGRTTLSVYLENGVCVKCRDG